MSSRTPGGSQPQATAQDQDAPMSGETLKKMMKCIQQSSHLHISSAFELPKIYAVGSQSTGKSSVIEALSGIKLPRGTGTCTRCPIEINLLKNDGADASWTCKIYLVKDYNYNPASVPDGTNKPVFWPWSPQEEQISYFAGTTRKENICDLIGRAQSAILNPNRPMMEFQASGPRPLRPNHLDFSPNTVQLKISGPQYYSLTFLDLPGIISVEENAANDHHVQLIEDLVEHHIKAKNSVILLTLPMDQDLHVQQAFRVIRRLKAEKRTLGVLTKPDLTKDLKAWQDRMLNMSDSMLGHGFHVVMLETTPSGNTPTMPGGEERFFEQPEWIVLEARAKGVEPLAKRLEQLLQERFRGSLPTITMKLNALVAEAETHLKEPSDAQLPGLLRELLRDLAHELQAMFRVGSQRADHFRNKWNRLADQFRAALETSAPSCKLATPPKPRRTGAGNAGHLPALAQPRRNQQNDYEDFSGEDAANAVQSLRINKRIRSTAAFVDYARLQQTFDFANVRATNQNMYDANIRGDVAPKAVDDLNEQSVSHWDKPTEEFVRRTGRMINEDIFKLVESVLAKFSDTRLSTETKIYIRDFLRKITTGQQERAMESCKIEQEYPQTRDQARFDDEEQRASEELLNERADILKEERAGKEPPKKARKLANPTTRDEGREQRDEYQLELKIMAKVRAYYRIASSRFVDNLCGSIQANMFPKCQDELVGELRRRLGSHDESDEARATIIKMMSSNAQQARTREDWQNRREDLRNMQASFEEFNLGSSVPGGWVEGDDDDEDMDDL